MSATDPSRLTKNNNINARIQEEVMSYNLKGKEENTTLWIKLNPIPFVIVKHNEIQSIQIKYDHR